MNAPWYRMLARQVAGAGHGAVVEHGRLLVIAISVSFCPIPSVRVSFCL